MKNYKLDLERYAVLARQATAEGCVLLENEGQAKGLLFLAAWHFIIIKVDWDPAVW